METSNVESRAFGCWDEAIAETGGEFEQSVLVRAEQAFIRTRFPRA
jgi:hypothetical protein